MAAFLAFRGRYPAGRPPAAPVVSSGRRTARPAWWHDLDVAALAMMGG